MKKLSTIFITFIFLTVTVHAHTWPYIDTVYAKTSTGQELTPFKLWLPKDSTIKAILIISERSQQCIDLANNAFLRSVASVNNFGIVLCSGGNTWNVDFNPSLNHPDSMLRALSLLAIKSGHPEVANCFLIAFGHSLGVYFARGMGYWSYSRVAGVISFKIGGTTIPSWASAQQISDFKKLPHFCISGELEGLEINSGANNYFASMCRSDVISRRNSNDLVAQYIELNGSHTTLPEREIQIIAKQIEKIIEYRIPKGVNAISGPVSLNEIAESSGYLGKSDIYNDFHVSHFKLISYNVDSAKKIFLVF